MHHVGTLLVGGDDGERLQLAIKLNLPTFVQLTLAPAYNCSDQDTQLVAVLTKLIMWCCRQNYSFINEYG